MIATFMRARPSKQFRFQAKTLAGRSEQDCLPENDEYILSLIGTRVTADEGAANLITLSVSTMTSSIRIKTGYR